MITRVFEQEWYQTISTINHLIEQDVLIDFFEYLKRMDTNLEKIKAVESDFNKKSKHSLKYYLDKFKKREAQFKKLCLKRDSFGILDYNDVNEKIYIKDGNHIRLKDKYYNVLSKIANSIFKIEEEVSGYVEDRWIGFLTNPKDYSFGPDYSYLIHADFKFYPQSRVGNELLKYNNSQQGLCFSLATRKKTRIFDPAVSYYNYYYHPNGIVGIIAKPNKGAILSMSDTDMLSTEFVNGNCSLERHFKHSKINRCFVGGNSEIYSKGTKILLPDNMFDIDVDTINEIILDSSKIDVQAVFFVRTPSGKVPQRFEEYKKLQEKKCGHTLKTIELNPKNSLKQFNLELALYE